MAPKGIQMGLVLILVVMLWRGAMAQSGCTSALVGMSPCLNFVTGNSSTPSSSCCSTLSNVVQSQPQCLCSLLNGGAANFGFAINQTLALTLPGACNVQTPPLSQCNAVADAPTSSADTPVSSPSGSEDSPPTPTATPTTTPSVPSIPSGTPSKTVPTTGSASDGSMLNFSFKFTVALLFIYAYAS